MRDSADIFPTFYAENDEGVLKVWAKVSTEFARVFYRPSEIEVDGAIEDDEKIWGDINDLLLRFKIFKGGEVTIDFSAENFNAESGNKRFRMRNIGKDIGREDNPSASDLWDSGKSFDKFVTEGKPFKAVYLRTGANGDDVEVPFDFAYILSVDTADIRGIIEARASLTNPSYYKLRVDKSGEVSMAVLDDDNERKGDEFVFKIGKVEYNGNEFSVDFRSGFDNVFKNLSGNVDLYFNDNTPMLINQSILDSEKKEVFNVTYLIMHSSVEPEQEEEVDEEKPVQKKPKGKAKAKESKPKYPTVEDTPDPDLEPEAYEEDDDSSEDEEVEDEEEVLEDE